MTVQPAALGLLPLELDTVVFRAADRNLIDGISLRFEKGPPTVILGPNGAGKSLLLRLCHGLLEPTAGRVMWQGAGARDAALRRFAQGMVFQKPVLLRRSVIANVLFPLKLRGLPAAARFAKAMAALERVGLVHLADRPARVLSGGEQQRLALGRAAALEPQVLFLDEPTANLDPAATRQVEDIVKSIAESGTKIVMTTHDLGQARRLAGDVVFLHRGRVAERKAADDFFAAPASAEAHAFLNGELFW